MSEETYYNVLGVSETATELEIKAAYRNLIKQVHPDTLPQTSAYWKKIAEDKAKELTEAYNVLTSRKHRATYDSLLKSHRQQSTPATAPPRSTPPQKASRNGIHKRYDWRPLKRWAGNHPILVLFLGLFALIGGISLFPDSPQATQSSQSAQSSQSKAVAATINSSASGPYSEFPCDNTQTVSPIDGKRCKPTEKAAPIVPRADEVEKVSPTAIRRPRAPRTGTANLSDIEEPRKPKPVAVHATVDSDYATLNKRCAFLPSDNYARCQFQPQTIAKVRKWDRLTVLSKKVRAENGEDIYRVRTEQGWEGWIVSRFIQID